jgi:hypothetical protein
MAAKLEHFMTVPEGYQKHFKMAELTFLHQRVYDVDAGRLTTLTPLDRANFGNDEEWEAINSFIGPFVEFCGCLIFAQ